MNLKELGDLLKNERERRGLSIRDVMDATKISRRNLNALEAGETRFLPHSVYLKGYVRNYARLVGLDAAPLVAVVEQQSDGDSGYLPQVNAAPVVPQAPLAEPALAPEPTGVVVEPPPSIPERPAFQERPARPMQNPEPLGQPEPKTNPNLRALIVLVLLILALIGLLYQFRHMQAEAPPPPPVPVAQPVAVADNATNATEAVPAENATAEPLAPAAVPAASAPAPAPAPAPVVAPQPAPASSVPAASIEVSRKAAQPAAAADTFASGGQDLVITVKPGEVCWMELSDGQKVRSFVLRGGESRKVEFGNKLRVRLGNAGGVTFRLNGEQYPFEGERGQKLVVEFGPR